jgi:phosphate transport system substrate-binding protein
VPIAFAATLLAYHGKGLPGTLRLSGPVLADIFLGKITHWNDPAIARLNPDAKLPATAITPVYRSDGSGDTYVFSAYLSRVSAEWRRKLGVATQLNLSAATGGRGNQGVAAAIDRTNGAIGYLGIPYVFSNHLRYALVQNAAGAFPAPGIASISAAARSASAPGAYPISTITYALVPRSSGKSDQLRAFLTYAIGDGQKLAPPLHFAPLPSKIRDAGRRAIDQIG